MAEANMDAKQGGGGRRWLRWLGIAVAAGLLLVVVAYFVVTSGAFFKGVILPRAGAAMGAEITVADASISPFSSVVLRDLQVRAPGAEPLLTVAEVRLRYSLMAFLRGQIDVAEAAVIKPVVRVAMKADGSSNLDPFLKRPSTPSTPPATAKSGGTLQLNVQKVLIQEAVLGWTQAGKDGSQMAAELSGLNFNLESLRNGQPVKLGLEAALKFAQAQGTNRAELAATWKSAFTADLAADLMPQRLQGTADLAVTQATGSFQEAGGFAARLATELDPKQVKQLGVTFTKGNATLGAITVSGPLDAATREGRLKLNVTGIGNELLSLVGGRFGIYFGSTRLAAEYDIELKQQGRYVNTTGALTVDKFSVTRNQMTTPVIDFRLGYNATVDLPHTNATVRSFTIDALQSGRPLLKAGLTRELVLDWGRGAEGVADSTLELNVTGLNLTDWKPFLGDAVRAGEVSGQLRVNVQKAGKLVGFDLATRLAGLAGEFGSNRVDQADATFGLQGKMTDFDVVELSTATFELTRQKQAVTRFAGTGRYVVSTRAADFRTELSVLFAPLLRLLGSPEVVLSSGVLQVTGAFTQKAAATPTATPEAAFNGRVQVSEVTGRVGASQFDRLEAAWDVDAGLVNNVAEVRRFAGSVKQAGQNGGAFDLTAKYRLAERRGEAAFKLTDFNQAVLRSALAPALAPMTLESMGINAALSAQFDAAGDSAVKGDLQITNVVVVDPRGQIPRVPVSVGAALEATANAQGVFSLKQFAGGVRQGTSPAGDFAATGRFDRAQQTGQFGFKLAGLNQTVLQPFVARSLGDRSLASVAINANLEGAMDLKAATSVKGEFQVTNLVIKSPQRPAPAPLEARLKLDAGLNKAVTELRALQLNLTPTARANNQLDVTGRIDAGQTGTITGNLKFSAAALDVTRYYELAMGGTPSPTTTAQPAPATRPAPAGPEKEMDPIVMPLRNFVIDGAVQRFYLGEVEITNFVTQVKLDGGSVVVKPFQLALNGAPVNGTVDLDLARPGYRYDVGFEARSIPLPPLVNTFAPSRAGQIHGTATAGAQIKGAGTTGASLQKNLAGQFGLTMTNLDLAVLNLRSPVMKSLVNVVAGIPELIRNPAGGLSSLVGRLTGAGGTNSAYAQLVNKSPIDQIILQGTAGNGQVQLQQAFVQSPAFQANASGVVGLAAVLTNSTLNIPVRLTLERSLAESAGLAGNTPTNAAYAKLPDFVTMKGTLGAPKSDINYPALLAVAAKAGAGVLGQSENSSVSGAAKALNAVGNLLGGSGGNKDASGSAPAANQGASGLTGALNSLLGGNRNAGTAATNATNNPARTNSAPIPNPAPAPTAPRPK